MLKRTISIFLPFLIILSIISIKPIYAISSAVIGEKIEAENKTYCSYGISGGVLDSSWCTQNAPNASGLGLYNSLNSGQNFEFKINFNAPNAGKYKLTVRYAKNSGAGTNTVKYPVSVNGSKAGDFEFITLGASWNLFATSTEEVYFNQGINTVTIDGFGASTGVDAVMLDWIKSEVSIRYEAEYARTNGIGANGGNLVIENLPAASNGKFLGWLNTESRIYFDNISGGEGGYGLLKIALACGSEEIHGGMTVIVNGEEFPIKARATSWTTFYEYSLNIHLNEGFSNNIVLENINDLNIDYIELDTSKISEDNNTYRYEFESADSNYEGEQGGKILIESEENASGGARVGWINSATVFEFKKVIGKNAGKAKLKIGYAIGGYPSSADIYVNDVFLKKLSFQKIEGTEWNTYDVATLTVTLNAGAVNTIRIENVPNFPYSMAFDYIEISPPTEIFYDFEDMSNGIINVSNPSSTQGQIIGDVSQTDGYEGSGAYLNGGYISVPVDKLDQFKQATVQFDFKLGNSQEEYPCIISGQSNGSLFLLDILRDQSNMFRYLYEKHINNGMTTNDWNISSFQADKWYKVTYTLDTKEKMVRIYIDGRKTKEFSIVDPSSMPFDFDSFFIGARPNGTYPFKGVIDNFILTDEIIVPEEEIQMVNVIDVTPDNILYNDKTTVMLDNNGDIYVVPKDTELDKDVLEQAVVQNVGLKSSALKGELKLINMQGFAKGEYIVVAKSKKGIISQQTKKLTVSDYPSNATTSFNIQKKEIDVDRENYFKKHELINRRKPYTGKDGVPMGNGAMLALSWNKDDFNFQVTRSDLFKPNKSTPEGDMPLSNFPMDNQPALGRIAFKSTGNKIVYDFDQRLSIYDAVMDTNIYLSRDKEKYIKYKTFIDANSNAMIIDYSDVRDEAVQRTLDIELWAGRNPVFDTENGIIYVSEIFEDSGEKQGYTMGIKIDGATASVVDSKTVRLTIPNSNVAQFKIYISSVLGVDKAQNIIESKRIITQAEQNQNILALHKQWWRNFWEGSFVQLSDNSEADYIESLYYAHLYQMASSARYSNPPSFNGKGWTHHNDEKNWGTYFWNFNTRSMYYSLPASNKLEFMKPYFRLYNSALPTILTETPGKFKKPDGRLFKIFPNEEERIISGAKIPETMNFDGRGMLENNFVFLVLTTGVDVSMNYWWYYKYTNDNDFLINEAYPLIKEVANFLMSYARKNSEGYYDLWPVNSLELNQYVKKSTNTLGAFKKILNILMEIKDTVGAEADLVNKWQDYQENLQPFPLSLDGDIYASAVDFNNNIVTIENGSWQQPPNENIFPYELYSKGDADYITALNTFNRRGKVLPYEWTPEPQQAARLGLREETADLVVEGTKKWQTYPNGMNMELFRENTFLTEWLSTVAASVNDMLLLTTNNIIKVFPALTTQRGWDNTKFTLRAQNGFMVTAERKDNIVKYVAVESLFGNRISIENPWGRGNNVIVKKSDGTQVYSGSDSVIQFDTDINLIYIFEKQGYPYSALTYETVGNVSDRTMKKTLGSVTYGYGDLINIPDDDRGIRINAGGNDYVDEYGRMWKADKPYNGSFGYTIAGEKATFDNGDVESILGQGLYLAEAFGKKISYQFSNLTNDVYKVKLHLVENYFNSEGARSFDVKINNIIAEQDIDTFKEYGFKKAGIREYYFPSDNGNITVELTANTDNVSIAGIEIVKVTNDDSEKYETATFIKNLIENGYFNRKLSSIGIIPKKVGSGINDVEWISFTGDWAGKIQIKNGEAKLEKLPDDKNKNCLAYVKLKTTKGDILAYINFTIEVSKPSQTSLGGQGSSFSGGAISEIDSIRDNIEFNMILSKLSVNKINAYNNQVIAPPVFAYNTDVKAEWSAVKGTGAQYITVENGNAVVTSAPTNVEGSKKAILILKLTKGILTQAVEYEVVIQPYENSEDSLKQTFEDTPSEHFAFNYIENLNKKGVMIGAYGKFLPNENLTRAEAAAIFTRAFNLMGVGKEFGDVKKDDWFYDYVNSISGTGIMKGKTENSFSPFESITRQDFAVMAGRYLKNYKGVTDKENVENPIDIDQISQYAISYIKILKSFKIMSGNEKGEVLPNNLITRAEAAKIISLLMEVK